MVVLDKDNMVLRPAKLWCDVTSAEEAEELSRVYGTTLVPSFTGGMVQDVNADLMPVFLVMWIDEGGRQLVQPSGCREWFLWRGGAPCSTHPVALERQPLGLPLTACITTLCCSHQAPLAQEARARCVCPSGHGALAPQLHQFLADWRGCHGGEGVREDLDSFLCHACVINHTES